MRESSLTTAYSEVPTMEKSDLLLLNDISPVTTKPSSDRALGMEILLENGKKTPADDLSGPIVSTKLYRRRWLILILFVFYSMSNAYQWIQYSIINNIVTYYFRVESILVNFTSIIYMAAYIPLIFPASWLLNKKGLRYCVLIGSLGTLIGAWIKCASVGRNLFGVTFFGQTVVAVSQIFILGIPSRLAAVWFGAKEVSTACSIGVFGNQLGVALGFLIPPVVVKNITESDIDLSINGTLTSEDAAIDAISHGFRILFFTCAAFCTVLFILIVIFFQDKPKLPPSQAAASASEIEDNYKQSVINLVSNKNYDLLLLSYGINVGVFYGISVLLNQTFLSYFPGHEEDCGRIGLIIVLSGMLGSVVCGLFLDRTHKFKQTTLAVYALAFIGMIMYAYIFQFKILGLVYVIAAFLGFFMTGYLPVGFEFAVELTYPESEGTSSGLLNASAQIFGIIFTFGAEVILTVIQNDVYANLVLAGALFVGLILTAFISPDLRRQQAQKLQSSETSSP